MSGLWRCVPTKCATCHNIYGSSVLDRGTVPRLGSRDVHNVSAAGGREWNFGRSYWSSKKGAIVRTPFHLSPEGPGFPLGDDTTIGDS